LQNGSAGLTFTRRMDEKLRSKLVPGQRVKVTQQIAARNYTLTSEIVGTIVCCDQQQTGSWYAHSKNDKLWLDRLTLRKDDGEITTLNLDDYSVVSLEPTVSETAAAGSV